MLAESSNDARVELKDTKVAAEVSWPGRLLLLVLNALPLAHVAAVALAIVQREFLAAFAILYLAPALVARAVLAAGDFKQTRILVGSAAFFRWWTLFQLQVIFCRFPALEEVLRLAPGL